MTLLNLISGDISIHLPSTWDLQKGAEDISLLLIWTWWMIKVYLPNRPALTPFCETDLGIEIKKKTFLLWASIWRKTVLGRSRIWSHRHFEQRIISQGPFCLCRKSPLGGNPFRQFHEEFIKWSTSIPRRISMELEGNDLPWPKIW